MRRRDLAATVLAQYRLDGGQAADQSRLAEEIQQESFREVPIVRLGRYFIRTAYRSDLTGLLKNSIAFPWNVRRI